jgi:hypothetical protein
MLKRLILAATALMIAAPVMAHDRDHGRGHHRHHFNHRQHFHHFHPRPLVVMPPPRVFYAPPAPVYYAPPAVVYRPAPVYAQPVPQSSVSIRLHFPL